MNTRHKWTPEAKEVLLTYGEKVDKKGFAMRARQRGCIRKGTKKRYPTEEERFDGCCVNPVLEEKE